MAELPEITADLDLTVQMPLVWECVCKRLNRGNPSQAEPCPSCGWVPGRYANTRQYLLVRITGD